MPSPRSRRPAEKISLLDTDPAAHEAVVKMAEAAAAGSPSGLRIVIDRSFPADYEHSRPEEMLTAFKSVSDTLAQAGFPVADPHPWGNDKTRALISSFEFLSREETIKRFLPNVVTQEYASLSEAAHGYQILLDIRQKLFEHPALVVGIVNPEASPHSFQSGLRQIMHEAQAQSKRLAVVLFSSAEMAEQQHSRRRGLHPQFAAQFARVDVGPSPFAEPSPANASGLADRLAESRKADATTEGKAEPKARGASPV